MPAKYSVWVDKEDQFLCQQVIGDMDGETMSNIFIDTNAITNQLDSTDNLYMLFDARKLGKGDSKSRQMAHEPFEKYNVRHIALWGAGPFVSVVMKFFNIRFGKNKMKVFSKEEDARKWLRKMRREREKNGKK